MKPPVETVRLSGVAREQLIQIKRATGEGNWNVCCRWALCYAISVPEASATDYSKNNEKSGDVVEMHWSTFAGTEAPAYSSLLQMAYETRGRDLATVSFAEFFYRLMYFGISALSRKSKQDDMPSLAILTTKR
jgi:DNA sulfur modification protein DndE